MFCREHLSGTLWTDVWESHADADDLNFVKPAPERTRSVYMVSEPAAMPAGWVVAAIATGSV